MSGDTPARDLVAAFMEVLPARHLTEELAQRMAAVAQARIDAAVAADRARIRGELDTKARDLEKRRKNGAMERAIAYRDAIAVVDEDTGDQR